MKRIAQALAALSLLALAAPAPALAEDKGMAPPVGAATTEKTEHQAKVAPPAEGKVTAAKHKRHHEKRKTVAKNASKDTGKDAGKMAPAAGDAAKHP